MDYQLIPTLVAIIIKNEQIIIKTMNSIYKRLVKLTWLLTTIIVTSNLQAQGTWNSYSHVITEQGYAGLKFKYTAFVRTEVEDIDAIAALWVRVDKNGENGFFDNMIDRPIKTNEWKEFTIEGTFDEDYTQIAFGLVTMYNGNFYFDDVNLEIQTKDKKWKSIYKTGFEKGLDDWERGIGKGSSEVNSLYKGQLSHEKPKSGNQCLLVQGEGIPNYGTNSNVGKYAEVNGIKLYYEVYGEGHPLVVLHGNGGSSKDAAPHYPELIKKYKVIVIDNRGQGKSTDTDSPLTYNQMASDVNALLEELKIDSVYIWGQSDGAILGLLLAINHPQRVKKLLAFGANTQPDSTAVFYWAIADGIRTIKKSSDLKEKKLNQLMLDHPNIPFSSLSKIKIPVLVMAGDRDVIRPEHTLKLFQNIPQSQLCILPGTTHGASWEKKDLFLKLLYDFFDEPFTMPTTKDWYK